METITSPIRLRQFIRTYVPRPVDNASADGVVSVQAFRWVRNKFFVVQNLDTFAGIVRHFQINHGDVRSPRGDSPNSLRKSRRENLNSTN